MGLIRKGIALGLLAGVGAAVARTLSGRQSAEPLASAPPAWPPLRQPVPAEPLLRAPDLDVAAAPGPDPQPDREPQETLPEPDVDVRVGEEAEEHADDTERQPDVATPDWAPRNGAAWVSSAAGACPLTHPVKAKVASGIFHVPGMANYERTRADRCYTDEGAAEADGLRKAKR